MTPISPIDVVARNQLAKLLLGAERYMSPSFTLTMLTRSCYVLLTVFVAAGMAAAPSIAISPGVISGPIKISGNVELTESALVSSGQGTPEDPYVIEGYHFTAWQYGLWIHDVSLHLLIRNNAFVGVTESSAAAIMVTSSQNLMITENFISTHKAISLEDSSNIQIHSNEHRSPLLIAARGIVLANVSDIDVHDNTIRAAQTGLEIYYSDNVSLRDNFIMNTNAVANGIQLWREVVDSKIVGNEVIGPGTGVGLVIADSSRIDISMNQVTDWSNAVHGFQRPDGSDYGSVSFRGNVFEGNKLALVYHDCPDCDILGNTFTRNGHGLELTPVGRVECNKFKENDVALHVSTAEVLRNNSFLENRLNVENSDVSADLRWNWWGSSMGPDPDTVEGPASYEPWLVVPPEKLC